MWRPGWLFISTIIIGGMAGGVPETRFMLGPIVTVGNIIHSAGESSALGFGSVYSLAMVEFMTSVKFPTMMNTTTKSMMMIGNM